jgi:hypothetical protein
MLPEILWTTVDDYDWLALDAENVSMYGARLADADVTSMVLITPDPWRDLAELPGWAADPDDLGGERSVWVVPINRTG